MSSVGGGAARDEGPDQGNEPVEDEADDADVDKGDDDVGKVRAVPGIPDEEADADPAGQHLGRHDGEPGEADRDAQPGKQNRADETDEGYDEARQCSTYHLAVK